MEGLGSQEWERGFGDREESGEGKAAEYQQRKGLCQAGIAKAAALCRRISRWRMAVFLLVGLFFYGGHQWHPALYLAAAAGCILFLLLIGWHNQAEGDGCGCGKYKGTRKEGEGRARRGFS